MSFCLLAFASDQQSTKENTLCFTLHSSQVCKLLEHIIRDEIVIHLESHRLITDERHGFRTGRSCLTNLLVFLDQVSNILDSAHCADNVM